MLLHILIKWNCNLKLKASGCASCNLINSGGNLGNMHSLCVLYIQFIQYIQMYKIHNHTKYKIIQNIQYIIWSTVAATWQICTASASYTYNLSKIYNYVQIHTIIYTNIQCMYIIIYSINWGCNLENMHQFACLCVLFIQFKWYKQESNWQGIKWPTSK